MAYSLGQRSVNDLQRIVTAAERLRDAVQGQPRHNGVGRIASLILDRARANCPVSSQSRPGHVHLRDTLGVRAYELSAARTSYGIGTDDPRGLYVEMGTAPHVIEAKPGSALFWPGAAHPVKRVKHPGSKPHPFLLPAAEDTQPEWGAALADALGSADPGAAMRSTFVPGRGV